MNNITVFNTTNTVLNFTNSTGSVSHPQCPSWAAVLGYTGVAAAVCLSNFGSAVSPELPGFSLVLVLGLVVLVVVVSAMVCSIQTFHPLVAAVHYMVQTMCAQTCARKNDSHRCCAEKHWTVTVMVSSFSPFFFVSAKQRKPSTRNGWRYRSKNRKKDFHCFPRLANPKILPARGLLPTNEHCPHRQSSLFLFVSLSC